MIRFWRFALTFLFATSSESINDICAVNPCENNCDCESLPGSVNKDSQVRYRCTDDLNSSCTWASQQVQCGEDVIQIIIPHWLLIKKANENFFNLTTGYPTVYLTTSPVVTSNTCEANVRLENKHEKSYRAEIPFPFTMCGTISKIIRKGRSFAVQLKNSVRIEKTVGLAFSYPITLHDVVCTYTNKTVLRSLVDPICCEPKKFLTQHGSVEIYAGLTRVAPTNANHVHFLGLPTSNAINDDIFVVFELEKAPHQQYLAIKSCHVSTDFDKRNSTDIVRLLKNGCVLPGKLKKHGTEIIASGIGERATLKFNVFKFNNNRSLYIHCHLVVCEQECLNQCLKPRGKRSGRSRISLSNRHLILSRDVTIGPIRPIKHNSPIIVKPPNNMNNIEDPDDKFSRWMIPSMLAVTNLTCIALLGALSYALARTITARRQRKRRKKSSVLSDLFSPLPFSVHHNTIVQDPVHLLKITPQSSFFPSPPFSTSAIPSHGKSSKESQQIGLH